MSNSDLEPSYDPDFHQAIVDAYKAGLPDHVVARIFDVSNTLVRRGRQKKASPMVAMLRHPAIRDSLVELRQTLDHVAFENANPHILELSNRFRLAMDTGFAVGVSEADIAHLFGASRPTVRRWLIHSSTPHPAMLRAFIAALEEEIAKRAVK